MHAEGHGLSRVCEFWYLRLDVTIIDGLRQAHQRGHLSIEYVGRPPDFAASLNHVMSEVLHWHVGVHSLCHGYAHSLANLDCCQ